MFNREFITAIFVSAKFSVEDRVLNGARNMEVILGEAPPPISALAPSLGLGLGATSLGSPVKNSAADGSSPPFAASKIAFNLTSFFSEGLNQLFHPPPTHRIEGP